MVPLNVVRNAVDATTVAGRTCCWDHRSRERTGAIRCGDLIGRRDPGDAEPMDEETLPARTGTIAGRVYDSRTSEAIEGLGISLDPIAVEGEKKNKGRFVETAAGGAYENLTYRPGDTASKTQ